MSEEFNKKISTESYKGVRDFYPEDMFVENYIFGVWKKTCESFGYSEYNASILEPTELYKAKSSEEIVTEQTYTFTDRGGRDVTLRPEMTPTVARMIAQKRRDIPFPARWYSIPNLFRYERPQRGRLREHFQLNVDIFGVDTHEAEIEIISIAHAILKNFGLSQDQFIIKINDKGFFRKTLKEMGINEDVAQKAATLLDKRGKIENFEHEWKQLTGEDFNESSFKNPHLQSFIEILSSRGIKNVVADETLVRGFDYYSGIVFEVFDTNPENKRSLFGGGRYDNLVELFGGEKIPAVGFGMGDVTIRDVLETYNLLPTYLSTTNLYICLVDHSLVKKAEEVAEKLRSQGLNVALDLSDKKIGDQIKKADKEKIPYVLVIGEEECKTGRFKLKELKSGTETEIALSDIPGRITLK